MSESENSKKQLAKQAGRILAFHFLAIFIVLTLFYFMLFSMWTVKVLSVILGFLSLIVYSLIIAATAKGIADRDLLPSAKVKPFAAKGLVLSAAVVILNLLILLSIKISWAVSAPESLKLAFQLLFFIITLPYNFFLNISGVDISGIGVILMFVIPIVSIGTGYYAGYRKWDIFEHLDKIAFEKKEK